MSDSDSRLLNFLLREASCNTDFQSWLELPVFIFAAGGDRHTLKAGD